MSKIVGFEVYAVWCVWRPYPWVRVSSARRISRRSDHMTPMLRQLHRLEFKISSLVHQSLSGQAPTCLAADDINPVTDSDQNK